MVHAYIESNKQRFLDELFELLRLPSVSADSRHKADVRKTAERVMHRIKEAGADHVELVETKGHPIVFGQKMIDPAKPTVLVYGHYDVQPPDPLELWKSPAFEPTVRDGKIYARGACDDKGQFYMHIKAFEILMKQNSLPCNVKFMIEGEGLIELARHLQAGTVLALHEYAASVWPNGHAGPWIRSIRRLGPPEGGPQAGR